MKNLDAQTIEQALTDLGERLALRGLGPYHLVVCGGAALIVSGLVSRLSTRDVDVVAMMDGSGLISPDPFPEDLQREAEIVRANLDLPEDWINNGPSRDPGGLYQVGLPEGLETRLQRRAYGERLTVHYISRLDQIHLKVYASADSGPGRHVEDLKHLAPTAGEIEQGARWAMTQDPSDGFGMILQSMLKQMGFDDVADRI